MSSLHFPFRSVPSVWGVLAKILFFSPFSSVWGVLAFILFLSPFQATVVSTLYSFFQSAGVSSLEFCLQSISSDWDELA